MTLVGFFSAHHHNTIPIAAMAYPKVYERQRIGVHVNEIHVDMNVACWSLLVNL